MKCPLPQEHPLTWIALAAGCCAALVQVALAAPPANAVKDFSGRNAQSSSRNRSRGTSGSTASGPNSHESGYQNRSRRWPAEPGLSYRRIYAPAKRMADWPTGGQRYLPVDAEQLDRLLERVRRQQLGAPAPDQPTITTARFQARLDGDVLVAGQAQLDIAYRGKDEAVLALEPCSLALARPCWNADPAEPALVGRWPSGRFGVLVRQSGTLHFRWSLRARHDAEGDRIFRLQLPLAVSRQLELRLPADTVPRVDRGLVTAAGANASGDAVWRIQLEPQPLIDLRLLPAGAGAQTGLTLVQSQATYKISVRGIELEAQFALAWDHGPRDSVTLAVDPPLQLVAVRWGEAAAAWSVSPDGTAAAQRVVVPCDPAEHTAHRLLWVKALAPLAADRLVRLPRARLERAFWESGQVRILVEDPLLLSRLERSGCRQIHSEPMPAPRTGQSIELEEDAADASVELVFSRRPAAAAPAGGPPGNVARYRVEQQPAAADDRQAENVESASVALPEAKAAAAAPTPGEGQTGIGKPSSAGVGVAGTPAATRRPDVASRAKRAAASLTRRPGAAPSAWVWRETLRSEIATDGTLLHTLAYRIENAGRHNMRWSLPAGTEVKTIWRDGRLLPVAACLQHDRRLEVGLAPDRPYTTVVLHVTSRQGRLGTFGCVRIALPVVDSPVLARDWSVWLPVAYEPAGGDLRDIAPSWARRLFGPLASGWHDLGHRLPASAAATAAAATRSGAAQTPADSQRLSEVAAAPAAGSWVPVDCSNATGPVAVIGIVHRRRLQVLALAAFLAAAIVVNTWCRRRPPLLAVLLAAGAVVALAIPAALAPVATGAWLGGLVGWACIGYRGGR